jgi:hypothetical protein
MTTEHEHEWIGVVVPLRRAAPYTVECACGARDVRDQLARLEEIRAMALFELERHGLSGWRVQLSAAGGIPGRGALASGGRSKYGSCCSATRTISLSRVYSLSRPEAAVLLTIHHEIAHALTPGHAHDDVWRERFVALIEECA